MSIQVNDECQCRMGRWSEDFSYRVMEVRSVVVADDEATDEIVYGIHVVYEDGRSGVVGWEAHPVRLGGFTEAEGLQEELDAMLTTATRPVFTLAEQEQLISLWVLEELNRDRDLLMQRLASEILSRLHDSDDCLVHGSESHCGHE